MGRLGGWLAVGLVLACGSAGTLAAQEPAAPPQSGTLALFFDCQGFGCWDMDFFRREIPYLNWVRDREVADVHVLVTTQTTGGGGRQYTLRFLGRGTFQGQDQELVVNTAGDATEDEVRRALVARLRLGLGRYLAGTPMAERLVVMVPEAPPGARPGGPPGPPPGAPPQDDPWNFWVFTIRGSGFTQGESSYSSRNLSGSVSANRTTDAWKVNFSGRLSSYKQTFEIEGADDVEYSREDWNASGLVVRSITDRFSLGARLDAGRSTYVNEDFRWSVSPGVELNVFPYSESSKRSLTFQALANVRHWDYDEITIFGETDETRVAATLTSRIAFIQPWGRVSVSANHSRYLHDTDKWQAMMGGSVEVRLFKGFSVNVGGDYGWIRDQL
jgi:hypothetical protein